MSESRYSTIANMGVSVKKRDWTGKRVLVAMLVITALVGAVGQVLVFLAMGEVTFMMGRSVLW